MSICGHGAHTSGVGCPSFYDDHFLTKAKSSCTPVVWMCVSQMCRPLLVRPAPKHVPRLKKVLDATSTVAGEPQHTGPPHVSPQAHESLEELKEKLRDKEAEVHKMESSLEESARLKETL